MTRAVKNTAPSNSAAQTLVDELKWTNQRLAEEIHYLRRQQRGMTNGVIRMFAHDVRTPLSVIQQYASIMRGGLLGAVTAEQGECLETISTRTELLNTLVSEVVDFETLDLGALVIKRESVSVEEMCFGDVAALQAEFDKKGLQLDVDIETNIPHIFCDVERMQRAIRAFLNSLAKLSSPESALSLTVRFDHQSMMVLFELGSDGIQLSSEQLREINTALRADTTYANIVGETLGLGVFIARRFLHINLASAEIATDGHGRTAIIIAAPIFNIDRIFEIYHHRAKTFNRNTSYASLVKIDYDEDDSDARAFFEEVLQSVIRSTDLLFAKQSGEWLLVQPCNRPSYNTMIDRLHTRMLDLSQISSQQELPIHVEELGLWRWDGEYDNFCRAFREHYFSVKNGGAKPSPISHCHTVAR